MMQMMQQAQMEQQMAQQQQLAGAKEEGANYRKELDVATKLPQDQGLPPEEMQ